MAPSVPTLPSSDLALGQARPDAVFHAAAYKHVPVLETQLREAIRNNVLATETVIEQSLQAGVGTFVLVSTDKAVDPANVLGASKRLAEMICRSEEHTSEPKSLMPTSSDDFCLQ